MVSHRTGRFGKRAIAYALSERGIAPTDAAAALAQLDGRDEMDDARALWLRRFGQAPRDDREKARQVRFLQARGYSLSVALAVLRAGRGGDGADGADGA